VSQGTGAAEVAVDAGVAPATSNTSAANPRSTLSTGPRYRAGVQRIDHVIWAVHELESGAERFSVAHGLASVPGGVHPGWGTANRIVPLGATYVELMAIDDRPAAMSTELGRSLAARLEDGEGWFAFCLADDDIETTAARLGLAVEPGARRRPDGTLVSWRGAGIEVPERTADLPFFIAWDVPPDRHPGATRIEHPSGATGIAWVEVAGDRWALERWTGARHPQVRHVDAGPSGIRSVGFSTAAAEHVV